MDVRRPDADRERRPRPGDFLAPVGILDRLVLNLEVSSELPGE